MHEVDCVSCGRHFVVADDDLLWSITTALGDDGVERITGRFIEPPCPSCGKLATWSATAVPTPDSAVDDDGRVQITTRVEVALDSPYDPALSATENLESAGG